MLENKEIKNCIILCRVSSPKQSQQGESIADQEKICRGIAERENLNVLEVFREAFSGRKHVRPVVDDIKAYIKSNPHKVSCLIFRAIDRFTREGTLGYEALKQCLAEYGVRLIDSNGVIQPSKNTLEHLGVEYDWSTVRPSEITELVMAQQGKNEVNQILTRMIGAEINLVRDGYKVRQADDGYLNDKVFVDGKKRVVQISDPERAPYFLKMFEMRSSSSFTDDEIVDCINAMGYRSRVQKKWSKGKDRIIGNRGGVKLTVKQLQRIIQRPIYCGVNTEKWLEKPIKTEYDGLVSIKCFNDANRGKVYIEEQVNGDIVVRKDYNPHQLKRHKDNPLFPFKDVILCPECGKPFMGSSPKGKSGQGFPTYHCCRGHKYFGVPKEKFEKHLSNFITNLKYKEGFLNSFEATLMNKYREREKELGEFSLKVGSNVVNLESEKLAKIDAFTSTQNAIIRSELTIQIEAIQKQILIAQEQRNKVEIKENDIHAFVGHVKTLMEHPVKMLIEQDNLTILKGLYALVFDVLPTYKEIVSGTPKLSLPYKLSEEFFANKSPLVALRGIEPRLQP